MLLMGIISTGIVSCSDDNDSDVTPDPGEGQEVESAWLYVTGVNTPQGFVRYMEIHEEIPARSNVAEAVELGLNSRAFFFGEHPYTWNGNAAVMTKWKVDRNTLELTVDGVLSFASAGITGDVGEPAFLSETQSYFANLKEGVVLEWNPNTMEITETFNVTPLPDPGGEVFFFGNVGKYVVNGKIFMPFEYTGPATCCNYFAPNGGGAVVAVFDPATGTVEYVQDKRALAANNVFTLDDQGNRYVGPLFENFLVEPYFNVDMSTLPSTTNLIKFNDDGTFDPNFEFDFAEVIPNAKLLSPSALIFDNQILVFYLDSSFIFNPDYEDRYSIPFTSYKTGLVDLNTKELKPSETNQFGPLSPNTWAIVDGTVYFLTFGEEVNGEAPMLLLTRNSANNYTKVSEHFGGSIRLVAKLDFTD